MGRAVSILIFWMFPDNMVDPESLPADFLDFFDDEMHSNFVYPNVSHENTISEIVFACFRRDPINESTVEFKPSRQFSLTENPFVVMCDDITIADVTDRGDPLSEHDLTRVYFSIGSHPSICQGIQRSPYDFPVESNCAHIVVLFRYTHYVEYNALLFEKSCFCG